MMKDEGWRIKSKPAPRHKGNNTPGSTFANDCFRAPKARNGASFTSRRWRSTILLGPLPGALPQAITFRAFGAFKPMAQRAVSAFKPMAQRAFGKLSQVY